MIGIIDYGAGNLLSVSNALSFLGYENRIVRTPDELKATERLILPGVGAFPAAMDNIRARGLLQPILKNAAEKPFLGICLGMQLLFEEGFEFRACAGLGLIPGVVREVRAPGLKLPHMGWNSLRFRNSCPMLRGLDEGTYVYFVHSFCAETDGRYIAADTEHGETIPALVQNGQVFGAQFHPEKSSDKGLQMLKAFCEYH